MKKYQVTLAITGMFLMIIFFLCFPKKSQKNEMQIPVTESSSLPQERAVESRTHQEPQAVDEFTDDISLSTTNNSSGGNGGILVLSDNQIINTARQALKEKNVSADERKAQIERIDGQIVVTFLPKREEGKPLPRAGRYVITINEDTGSVEDMKIGR